jgi:histidinol-phosphatase (PHP family)
MGVRADSDFRDNFHAHTHRCRHAAGDVDDYCEAARRLGMRTLGFSDHTALPDDRWPAARMAYAELPGYVAAVEGARQRFPDLRILLGMECEYVPELHAWYGDELLGRYGFDYLVGAAHHFPLDAGWVGTYAAGASTARALRAFADYTVVMMRTGYFDFIAHPDLFGVGYPRWDAETLACSRDILAAAAGLGVALEINALGLRKQAHQQRQSRGDVMPLYPWLPFWEEAAGFDVRVIVNSDAHRPGDLQARTADAHRIAERCGLSLLDTTRIGTRRQATAGAAATPAPAMPPLPAAGDS